MKKGTSIRNAVQCNPILCFLLLLCYNPFSYTIKKHTVAIIQNMYAFGYRILYAFRFLIYHRHCSYPQSTGTVSCRTNTYSFYSFFITETSVYPISTKSSAHTKHYTFIRMTAAIFCYIGSKGVKYVCVLELFHENGNESVMLKGATPILPSHSSLLQWMYLIQSLSVYPLRIRYKTKYWSLRRNSRSLFCGVEGYTHTHKTGKNHMQKKNRQE